MQKDNKKNFQKKSSNHKEKNSRKPSRSDESSYEKPSGKKNPRRAKQFSENSYAPRSGKSSRFSDNEKENYRKSKNIYDLYEEGSHKLLIAQKEMLKKAVLVSSSKIQDMLDQSSAAQTKSLKKPKLTADEISKALTAEESQDDSSPSSSISSQKSGSSKGQKTERGYNKFLAKQREALVEEKKETAPLVALSQPNMTESSLQLDSWQHEALTALLNGHHVIIDAPTSAGKTRVVESYIESLGLNKVRLLYTSPVKSLSNDKFVEFAEKYGIKNVGINTGDFKKNLEAPIVLATLETYRNSLLGSDQNIQRHLTVFDEYHYLQDKSRGSAWEEAIIMTPPHTQLVLLSASVSNPEDFAEWIENLTNRKVVIIKVQGRPVPLVHMVYTPEGWVLASELLDKQEDKIQTGIKSFSSWARGFDTARSFLHESEFYWDFFDKIINAVDMNLSPMIVYVARRQAAQDTAYFLANMMRTYLQGSPLNQRLLDLKERVKTLPGWEYIDPKHQEIILSTGLAFHHSGLISPARLSIETLLKEGLLIICVGTMGISLGVNFAVKSACILDISRPSEEKFDEIYSLTERLQMIGRAGRRGKDKFGFCLWPNLARYYLFSPEKRERCDSALSLDPVTVLGILCHNPDLSYLRRFYLNSFKYRLREVDKVRNLDKKISQIISHLQRIKALEKSSPTIFGKVSRYFPQAGGFVIADLIASGAMNAKTFQECLPILALFCAPSHKSINGVSFNTKTLGQVSVKLQKYYPEELFPQYYNNHSLFREMNFCAPDMVKKWLDPQTDWKQFVNQFSSKNFSEGDCMGSLLRFATLIQSIVQLKQFSPELSREAVKTLKVLLRAPLDARNNILIDSVEIEEEQEGEETIEAHLSVT